MISEELNHKGDQKNHISEVQHGDINMFEELLANIDCGVAIYTLYDDGTLSLDYVNEGLCIITGSTKEEMMKAFQDDNMFTVDQEYREEVDNLFREAATKETTRTITYHATGLQGKTVWITARFSGVRREEGTSHVYATFMNSSNEIENARELQRKYKLEKRRSQEDSSTVAYAVFNLTTNQTIEMERRQPLLLLPYKMSMDEFKNDISSCILSDEQREQFDSIFSRQVLLESYKEGIEEQSCEFQRTLPNGKVIWVKSTFHLMVDSQESDVLLMYSCKDINLRKSLEIMTTYMANEDYDMIGCINFHDDSSIMLYGKNSLQKPENCNKYEREEKYSESLERFVNNVVVPEERDLYRTELFMEKIKKKLVQQDSYEFLLHVLGEDGTRLTKKIRYIRYSKELEICFFTQIDITQILAEEEEKRLEVENALFAAKQASEAKTEFFSRMSHDMRTPMNGILGMVELSQDETNVDVLKQNIAKIKSSGEYLLGLINDTLDFQKIESGKLELEQEVISATELFESITGMIKTTASSKGVNFQTVLHNIDFNWHVKTDPLRMKQIFLNLLSNAVKFTPVGGTVELKLELLQREGMISHERITVTDTGVGMSKEFIQNKIFQPFAQEYNEVTSHYAGTGLGLSIAKKLVELMGGTIEVESELGAGTKFTIYIDFERVDENAYSKVADEDAKREITALERLNGVKILLAEDHPLNAEIAKRLLQKAGCLVTWVKDGQECVTEFSNAADGQYDVILMDVRMPVMDGIAATKEIRKLEKQDAKKIPIIAMTANAYQRDVRNCLDAGMTDHLGKPIQTLLMYETIAKNLKQ